MIALRRRLGVAIVFALIFALMFGPASAADGPTAAPSDSTKSKSTKPRRVARYEIREKHDRDGIGKFYMGREIAHVMGYQGIDWLERPERETEEHLAQLVDVLKLTPGMVVADIGAGSGVISIKMADKVKPNGTVLAVDIQEEVLSVLAKRCKQLKITNVTPVRGTEKSPNLKPDSVDLAIMVDVYHEFRYPYEMLSAIAKALKPGGRVAFVEYRKEDPNVPIKLVHKMTEKQVKREAAEPTLDLSFVETIEVLPWQHIILFERRPAKSPAAQ
ncbi:MAG TPA: methyltransferase domain-containing protein [Planctomycetaceae bacterium]|jgi:precorrin-6B methylase 2|nr:methyltransferase domain-containing protein [Planctomycetaceae bacterium]